MINANMMAGRQRLPMSAIAVSTWVTRGSILVPFRKSVTRKCLIDEVYRLWETRPPTNESGAGLRRQHEPRHQRQRVGADPAPRQHGSARVAVAECGDDGQRVHGHARSLGA